MPLSRTHHTAHHTTTTRRRHFWHRPDRDRVAGGYTLSNPRTTKEGRKHAKHELQKMEHTRSIYNQSQAHFGDQEQPSYCPHPSNTLLSQGTENVVVSFDCIPRTCSITD
ncbi:hypothetical protein L218DRAFT_593409 [Marasmius fiardii PR-910]|nr:hypothetical protein L218DRAFT_593409 [Marasmius fiardii PR-910]